MITYPTITKCRVETLEGETKGEIQIVFTHSFCGHFFRDHKCYTVTPTVLDRSTVIITAVSEVPGSDLPTPPHET